VVHSLIITIKLNNISVFSSGETEDRDSGNASFSVDIALAMTATDQ
jgi:hypothetical protein